jgi:MerR family transcriptional regulator, light-induced transcriptional regulator
MYKPYANHVNLIMSRAPISDSPSPAPAAPAAAGPFRIHAVAEMTGIPEPTLRAWERRYGIPAPERTASGYRLYSLEEVEQVRAMRAACDGGMSAAEAARWVREQAAQGGGSDGKAAAPGTDPFESAQATLLDAIERFDEDALEACLRQMMFMGSSTAVFDNIVSPTLYEVGVRWHQGELSIAQEHFATQRLGKFTRDLMQLAAASTGATRVVLGAFADDEHEIGLLGLGLRLATWGFRPIFLGAKTPPGAIRNAVDSVSPGFVALSVTLTPERARARELIDDYANACGDVPWLVGGAGVRPIATLIEEHGGLIDPGDPLTLRAMIREALDASRKPTTKQKGKK